MLFSSLSFLFGFLPIVLFIYYISENKYKNIILLSSSLFFYAYGGPKYTIVMLLSIMLNYIFGLLVDKYNGEKSKTRIILLAAIISNLSLLGYYKYLNFFVDTFNNTFGSNINIAKIIMPIGISFYTFQGLSYVVDVYRKHGKVQKNPLNVALYISLFPQLIAGPIVRYETVAEQIGKRHAGLEKIIIGIERFIIGLSKKILIANTFAKIADEIFAMNLENMTLGLIWIGVLAYTIQIYFDFSGYSDMAIGLGKMFGFDFLENFNYPYISKSITEFWRRWHISLGTWFRDYIYIPLGGNRVSTIRHILNTFVVWLLTGFWHGASWNFIVWGIYFGLIILLEKYIYGRFLDRLPSFLRHSYALLLIMVGWVFFRAENLNYALTYLQLMFDFKLDRVSINQLMRYFSEYKFEWIIAIIASTPICKTLYDKMRTRATDIKLIPKYMIKFSCLLLLFFVNVIYLVASTYNPFIYFRF